MPTATAPIARVTGKWLPLLDDFRINCFESTFVHLTERFNNKEVFLVGTTNSSTMLAQRTQKLIEEVQPEAVMVMTNDRWWKTAKMLEYVDSQQEMDNYNKHLQKYVDMQSINIWNPTRSPIFWARWYINLALLKLHFKMPSNYGWLLPGLEVKVACEAAER